MWDFLRDFGTDDEEGSADMTYPTFASAIGQSGFNLSKPETKQLFNEFRIAGASGERVKR